MSSILLPPLLLLLDVTLRIIILLLYCSKRVRLVLRLLFYFKCIDNIHNSNGRHDLCEDRGEDG
eukprot:scaffold26488_cov139-Skeletonema_menzelii.AAC.1